MISKDNLLLVLKLELEKKVSNNQKLLVSNLKKSEMRKTKGLAKNLTPMTTSVISTKEQTYLITSRHKLQ